MAGIVGAVPGSGATGEDGNRGKGIHMGDGINSEEADYCPMVTPDGKYFYFTQGDDVMWMGAGIIDTYRE